ncbi:hypothetical protein LGL08_20640 [Clostridium estertheticum]|uniref:hypothetical protein n=1 Tax=Clostridium estertheticum TaxID=238834 RepID=UPI001CF41141|nr:hypothetical protein [Clostridium estertheticum]MCB2308883.1 hypothetical protein [Clostridium estertheticum]MCB2347295.1 hypothetical protein [Clostridium estertheticum]MCB2351938.1 hypothetical protein [Clostridium estertheticum]WAG48497.1 hypothetical protein LL127_23540 [Clostridium estertheticum]
MDGKCPVCGKIYKGRNKYACSMACYAMLKTNKKVCIICGKEFNDPKCNDTVTCSKECSAANRKNPELINKNLVSLEKAHEVVSIRPLTGPFETNINARAWRIQAPSGEIFECRNLKLWLREHEDMLDGTVAQAWDGITKIKYTMQGKRKNKSHQWKGWQLIEWGN